MEEEIYFEDTVNVVNRIIDTMLETGAKRFYDQYITDKIPSFFLPALFVS